ncbi:small subunit ribosomal protein S3, partial [Candidatus Hakubella thermalkaliphila]
RYRDKTVRNRVTQQNQKEDQSYHCLRHGERRKLELGQKVNPVGMRIGIINDWKSKWFTSSAYADYLREDMEIRNYLATALVSPMIPLQPISVQKTSQYDDHAF